MLDKCSSIKEMTLDEAIAHCREIIEELIKSQECAGCIAQHSQLLGWLEELKSYKERDDYKR